MSCNADPSAMIDVAAWGESRGFGVESGPASVSWGLRSEVARCVIAALNADLDPSGIAPGAWAVAVQRADGSVVATSSPACEAGICWTRREGPQGVELLVSPFVGGVVSAPPQAQLDDDFIAQRCGLPSGATQSTTPFANVYRIPPGVTATWSDSLCEPKLHAWCGPDAWEDPTEAGNDLPERYLNAFDESIDAMVPGDGPLCATMSGGLDSTFMVASLARHATADRPIHAFVHSPDPRARLGSKGNWDPDDFPVAAAMSRRYPHVVLHRVVNDKRIQPLDVAELSARRLWMPAPNTSNQTWFRLIDVAASQLGAQHVFVASRGNAAFSDSHMYAAAYHARRGDWRDVAAIARPYPGTLPPGMLTGPALVARQFGFAVRAARREHEPAPPHPWSGWVPDAQSLTWQRKGTPRQRYLQWLAWQGKRAMVTAAAGWQAPQVDPFASEPMLNLAASIRPSAWARAGSPRGFARRVAEGRLPDEIRLRTRRGGQSWDTWYTIHDQRQRHLDAAEALIADPTLGRWVDADALLGELRSWPWGQPHADPPLRLLAAMDLLALGVAWRTLRSMIQA